MDFKDQEKQCIEPYNECVEDPYDYTLGDCGCICNDQYPNRINYIQGESCYKVDHDWIMNAYSNEFSVSSAQILANYCDCINQCVAKTRVAYDIELRCTPKLESCCERVSDRLNPDYDYSQDTMEDEEDDEEKGYFTISSIKGDGHVEVIRSGTDNEVSISNGGRVNEGDTLLVGYKTTVMLSRDDGYYLSINEMSVIFITKAYFQESLAEVQINLKAGSMTSKVQPANGLRAKFEIKTPTSVLGVRGTIFTVEYDDITGVTNAYAHYHDIYFMDDFEEYSQDISEGEYISYDMSSEPIISEIPSNKILSEDLFSEYGSPTSDVVTTLDSDSSSSFGWILFLACLSGVFTIGFIVLLVIGIKKKKKALTIISIVFIIITALSSLSSLVIYLLVNKDTTDYSDTYEIETDTMSLFENNDGKYSFFAGDITNSLIEVGPNYGFYTYCYPTDSGLDSSYSDCDEGYVEVFSIREIGEVGYEEEYVSFVPSGNFEIVGTSDDGYYYILETPNGEMPSEIQPITKYIDEVLESFEIN